MSTMKKVVQIACCALGGIMVGFFANQLSSVIGCVCFVLGIVLLVGAITALSKENNKNE